MDSEQGATGLYQYTIIGLGALVCLVSAYQLNLSSIDLRFCLLATVTLGIGSRITLQIPRVKGLITVSDTLIFLAIILFDKEAAILLAAAEAFCSTLKFSKRVTTLLFNPAALACSTLLATQAFRLALGSFSLHQSYSANYIVALSVLASVQYAANSGFVALCAALRAKQPLWQTWRDGFLWTSLTYFAGAFAAGIISQLIDTFGFYALLSTTPVIAIVYFTYTTYLKNIEASNEQAEQAERHVAELRESEQRFRSAFDHAAGMALVAPDGRWVQVNRSLCEILGYSEQELLTSNFQSITYPDDLSSMLEKLKELDQDNKSTLQMEQRYVHKNRQLIWVLLSVTRVNESPSNSPNLVFQVQDIGDRKRVEERLVHDAFHDALTGLPNRVRFMDLLRQSMERAKRRKNRPFAVLFLDFDRFKLINDSLGHIVGDQLLNSIGSRLISSVRPNDTVARLGGDEFTILLDDLNDSDEAVTVARRVLRSLADPFSISGHEVFITASIGVALSTIGYDLPEDVMRDADTAMYRAKTLGKARYEVFDRTMHTNAVNLLQIETDLWRAVEREELTLDYQPIICLPTGRLAGFEALLRWQHPSRGTVSPMEFISVAEESGLIVPIGRWVLEQACHQMRVWQECYPRRPCLYVSVNLSAKQFMQPDFIDHVKQALEKTGLNPASLKVEITESMVMHNVESAINMLRQLRKIGIEISIDDFGTGYSSLSYLHRFPISMLKVDRSFVGSMTENEENLEIVRTIVALARNLKMYVIAEGVESQDQLNKLRAMNCEYGQGHFFSKALKAAEVSGLLAADLSYGFPAHSGDSVIDCESLPIA
jgi:diguanylate cyclase (GGDEF)-like protein/PAS domain S-box-containing protein